MSRLEQRLTRLEAIAPVSWTASDEAMLMDMSTPALATAVLGFAKDKAERRWLHTHGRTSGDRLLGGGWYVTAGHGWLEDTTEDERERLTQAELEALPKRWAELDSWCDEPDVAGWPPLTFELNFASFRRRVARERERLAVHRTLNHPLCEEWRRRHPEWHRGMTEAEEEAWELDLMARRLEDHKRERQNGRGRI